MSDRDDDDDITGSALGTKEYWEAAYGRDLENYESTDDAGDIWFGRPCQDRMIKWLQNRSDIDPGASRLLDLGCGNGALAVALRKAGYKSVTGVDYAASAVRLAQCVAEKQGFSDLHFQVCDVLCGPSLSNGNLEGSFDILLDKGTYDAIGLMENGSKARQQYKKNVIGLFAASSSHQLLIIASCNSTKDELLNFFSPEFACLDEIVAPNKIIFGGRTGSTVTTIVMQLHPLST